jgi:hypothetical protein
MSKALDALQRCLVNYAALLLTPEGGDAFEDVGGPANVASLVLHCAHRDTISSSPGVLGMPPGFLAQVFQAIDVDSFQDAMGVVLNTLVRLAVPPQSAHKRMLPTIKNGTLILRVVCVCVYVCVFVCKCVFMCMCA